MRFLKIFFLIMFFIPFICLCLYTIFYPRESALFGKRWQFKNEYLEPSEEAIKYHRTMGIIGLIIILAALVISIFNV